MWTRSSVRARCPRGIRPTSFTVDCTKDGKALDINGDEDGTQRVLSLHADDPVTTVDGIDAGATCTINETEKHDGTPSITVDGAASNLGNFEIVQDAIRAIVVTNDFPEVESEVTDNTPTPTAPDEAVLDSTVTGRCPARVTRAASWPLSASGCSCSASCSPWAAAAGCAPWTELNGPRARMRN